MEYILFVVTFFISIREVRYYKNYITPVTSLFFLVSILTLFNNIFYKVIDFNKISNFSISFILSILVIFLLVGEVFRLFKIKEKEWIIKQEYFRKYKIFKYFLILMVLLIFFRLFIELNKLGGINNFELLKEDRKNTVLSNIIETFIIFVPGALISFKERNKKNISIFFIIFGLVLFQNKNRVVIIILQSLYLLEMFKYVKLKSIILGMGSIVLIFFIIYNLKGFSQAGLELDVIKHNYQILNHLFLYLNSPLINIQKFNDISKGINFEYSIAPLIGVFNKVGVAEKKIDLLYDFYEVGLNKTSNVGSIFGEILYSLGYLGGMIYFFFLSIYVYIVYTNRKKTLEYSILASFILGLLSLSYFSNIFNLIFVWKRILFIYFIILIKYLYKEVLKNNEGKK